jgi:hypothetical protein
MRAEFGHLGESGEVKWRFYKQIAFLAARAFFVHYAIQFGSFGDHTLYILWCETLFDNNNATPYLATIDKTPGSMDKREAPIPVIPYSHFYRDLLGTF